jgi:hypothetical protein
MRTKAEDTSIHVLSALLTAGAAGSAAKSVEEKMGNKSRGRSFFMMGAQRLAELRFKGKWKTDPSTQAHGGAVSLAALEPEVCHDPNERGVLKGGRFYRNRFAENGLHSLP